MVEHDYIQMVLTEREREDIFRFKHAKKALQRRKGGWSGWPKEEEEK